MIYMLKDINDVTEILITTKFAINYILHKIMWLRISKITQSDLPNTKYSENPTQPVFKLTRSIM